MCTRTLSVLILKAMNISLWVITIQLMTCKLSKAIKNVSVTNLKKNPHHFSTKSMKRSENFPLGKVGGGYKKRKYM